MLTYKQAYDLLIYAYYKDEIDPYNPDFCFCGNLNENSGTWFNLYSRGDHTHHEGINYNGRELYRMEYSLLNHIYNHYKTTSISSYTFVNEMGYDSIVFFQKDYEDVLFEDFCKALDVLKQIHIERGEVIDEVCELSKRVLVK